MASTDVAAAAAGSSITQRARADFDPKQYELIRSFMPDGVTDAEAGAFLEMCARYQLDPFAKQVWAVKMQGKVQVVVAKDGFLALANAHDDFRGAPGDVVRAHDKFEHWTDDEGAHVRHAYTDAEGKPSQHPDARGPIVGSWAMCRREGHWPTFFYAEWKTYNGRNVWASHPEAMMAKVSEAMAIRKAYSISGMIHEAEAASVRQDVTAVSGAQSGEVRWPEDEGLRDVLLQLTDDVGWRRAKIRARVNGCAGDPDAYQLLITELRDEIGDDVPVDAEPVFDATDPS